MIVYLIRNAVNGKGYVGKTTRTLEARLWEHRNCANSGSGNWLHAAIRKHGWEAFEVTILQRCHTEEGLTRAEREWVAALGTYGPGGYNMTAGGDGSPKGRVVSEATRERLRARVMGKEWRAKIAKAAKVCYEAGHGELMRSKRKRGAEHHFARMSWGRKGPLPESAKAKISAYRRGRALSEEHKVAISAGCRGKPGPNLGKRWSESTRLNSLVARQRKKKPVFGYDEQGTCVIAYLSIADAVEATGLGWRILAGNRKKYRPKYVDGITYKRSTLTIEELIAHEMEKDKVVCHRLP